MKYIKDITPSPLRNSCFPFPGCPAIFASDEDGAYVLVGKLIDPIEYGISDRIAKDEVAISIPKAILRGLPNNS